MTHRLAALPMLLLGFVIGACAGDRNAGVRTIDFETNEGTGLAFDLSPDGRTIVFDLLGQLWTIPAEGGVATPLTDAVRDTAEDREPAFSPDGQSAVFRADRPGGTGLFVLSLADGSIRRLTTTRFPPDMIPAWSPDGQRIVFVRGAPVGRLHFVDASGAEVAAVTVDGVPRPALRDPAWSPDGSRLVFVNAAQTITVARRSDGRLWEVPADGGAAQPLTATDLQASAPAWSPDGQRLAFFAPDSEGSSQLWVMGRDTEPVQLTAHDDVTPVRVRWFPDGSKLLYHADGRLWTVPAVGGAPTEIPFTARVRFDRRTPVLRPVRFAEPGEERNARGHAGLALAPGGQRFAMIALGRLWVIEAGRAPRAIAWLPSSAGWPAWSPDEGEIAWSAGPWGEEDLFATDLSTGQTRRLTSLSGAEERPSWSPDGRRIAFNHQPADWYADNPIRVRVIPARGPAVGSVDATTDVGPGFVTYSLSQNGDNPISWSPDSAPRMVSTTYGNLVLTSLGGDTRQVRYPDGRNPTFLSWSAPGTLTWVESNRLWQAPFDFEAGEIGEPIPVSGDPALYPTVSRDGSILYVSGDGPRILRPGGGVERLGWPLTFSPPPPAPLIVRNVRVVGRQVATDPAVDIVIENGRVARILPAGASIDAEDAGILDAGGRFAIPGLMDLHQHTFEEGTLAGALYHGVTTIRDMGSSGIAWLADQRNLIEAGIRQGPRVVLGGVQFLGPVPGRYTGLGGQKLSDDSSTDRAMALLSAFGADYVKMRMFNDWRATARLVEKAHASGWPLSGHVASPLPLIAAGVDGMEHLGASGDRSDGIPYDDVLQLFRAADMWFVPTIILNVPGEPNDPAGSAFDDPEKAPFLAPTWRTVMRPQPVQPGPLRIGRRVARISRSATRKAHEAGITIAAGTDVRPWGLHAELEQLVASGLSPLEAITAATETAARVLGAYDEIGAIEEGKWADLVILNGDPLEDIRHTRDIWSVIKGGVEVDREALLSWMSRSSTVPDPVAGPAPGI